MDNALITGITGFVGSHLAEYLVQQPNLQVFGLARWRASRDNIHLVEDQIKIIEGDLVDLPSLLNLIRTVRPRYVFHLAAQSYVPYSFVAPVTTLEANCLGTCNLLEAIKIIRDDDPDFDPIVHICSSSEVYGQVTEDQIPITEDCPFRPASPYAVSKVAEDMLGWQYFTSWGIKTIRSRMFTHTGPRRGETFVVSTFAKQIAEAERAGGGKVLVGNLDSVRTFTDVRDAVKAYWLMVQHCEPGEAYNVGGVETMTIGEMLNLLIEMSDVQIEVVRDPTRLRPSDVTLQIPCCDKFKAATGWEPAIRFKQTLQDTLDYWRDYLRRMDR